MARAIDNGTMIPLARMERGVPAKRAGERSRNRLMRGLHPWNAYRRSHTLAS